MSSHSEFSSSRDSERGLATARFWGVRGSIPVPGPQTAGYGGNTSCVELRAEGQILILDSGTGLRALGNSLTEEFRGRPLSVTMLITHTHSDHIHGFPFFAPAYEASSRIRVLGFSQGGCGLERAFIEQMEPAYFPVGLSHMQGDIAFGELTGDAFQIGNIRVSTSRTNHPGVCGGYRIDTDAGSICYIPDHEADGTHAPECATVDRRSVIDKAPANHEPFGGIKVSAKSGWFAARPSGTENLYKIYAESFRDDAHLRRLLAEAQQIVDAALDTKEPS